MTYARPDWRLNEPFVHYPGKRRPVVTRSDLGYCVSTSQETLEGKKLPKLPVRSARDTLLALPEGQYAKRRHR